MLIDRRRHKLVNAINYFAQNTKWCGKTKLYKLLYFLDFQHYRETGRSVTGLDYFAWPKGPVPRALHDEIEQPNEDLGQSVSFREKKTAKGKAMLEVVPLADFDGSHFSAREMKLLSDLASQYRDAYADSMVEATHLENLPWHKVYEVEKRRQEQIPYDYALRAQEADEMREVASESAEVRENYR